MESIRNANTTCIAYCMNAIMSPTCIVDCATSCAPTHRISTMMPFRTSIITGMITTKTRLTKRLVLVSSTLARSNRSSSYFCRLNARTTIMPERFSRMMRLSRSMSIWMILNFGTAMVNATAMTPMSTVSASASVHHMFGLLSSAWMIAPMPMMGA